MDKRTNNPVKIYETKEFKSEIEKYFNKHEIGALRIYLAANPNVGEPSEYYPGLLSIHWGKNRVISIHYLVSHDPLTIYLTWVTGPDESLPLPDTKDGQKAKEFFNNLKRIGIGIGIRELWKYFGDLWPF